MKYSHESERLNRFLGKRVRITFKTIPETVATGYLRKRKDLIDGNSPYVLELERTVGTSWHFYKTLVKEIKEI